MESYFNIVTRDSAPDPLGGAAEREEARMRDWSKAVVVGIIVWAGAHAAGAQVVRQPNIKPVPRLRTAVCLVAETAVTGDRVHVRCDYVDKYGLALNKSSDHPAYFALPASSPRAAALMVLFESAGRAVRPLFTYWTEGQIQHDLRTRADREQAIQVVYDANDTSGTTFGCSAQDCRIPITVVSPGGMEKGD